MSEASEWIERHKAAIKGWDDVAGEAVGRIDATRWSVFSVGEAPEPADGYARIVCGDPVTPERLRRLFGNPLPADDTQED